MRLNLHPSHVVEVVIGVEITNESMDGQLGDVFHVWHLMFPPPRLRPTTRRMQKTNHS